MARFRLSTDILSPLNSDISLNDGSVFSFSSLPGTPVFDLSMASPVCSTSAKDADNSLTSAMKECADAFDEITNDIKRQSSINSEKEEKYKETYEMLKKSMDDLLFDEDFKPSISSPQLMNSESKIQSKMSTVGEVQNSKNTKIHKKDTCPGPENISETEKKNEKHIKDSSLSNRTKKKQNQLKSTSSALKSEKGTINKHEAHIKRNGDANMKKDSLNDQKKNLKIPSSKNDQASFEAKKMQPSKILPEKNKEKATGNVQNYHFKCQKKIPVSDDKPIIEKKNLSIEKPIQLAVSMEMDNIRRFVQDQNLHMHKDLVKLQEMVKKQNDVTDYLFSVIDALLDTNKKLISKCN